MASYAEINFSMNVKDTGANALGGPFFGASVLLNQQFADGIGANQFDRLYFAERTVASNTNDDIDLSGTAIQTALGVNIAAVELVGIAIINGRRDHEVRAQTPNTTNLTIGGSGSGVPGFVNAGLTIKPGGMFVAFSPDVAGLATITAGSGDILRITNSSGASNTYTIALLLRSA